MSVHDLLREFTNALDCCGTCAGGVLARHTDAAVNAALTEAADEVRANRERRHVLNWPDPKSEHVEDWLRERARRTT